MARIRYERDNIFDIPKGANTTAKGRVYINCDNHRVVPGDGRKAYTSHTKVCIGKALPDNLHGKYAGKMYGNVNYYRLFCLDQLPEPPAKADSISVGPRLVTEVLADGYGLISILAEVFGENDAALIMDLATYMLTEEKAVFQHYPSWARRHALYSATSHSDSYISRFLGDAVTYSKIDLFRRKWAKRHIGSGTVYFCYDSTNTNSQAEGVFLVQKGHAKDDPSLAQVNTDYIVRQEDGLPFSFMEFPGSITDVSEASVMAAFIREITDGSDIKITLVCDRGYISEENVELLTEYGISFLLMLKSNMNDHAFIMDNYSPQLKNQYEYYMDEFDEFGMTIKRPLFGKGPARYFHLIWNQALEGKHRAKLLASVQKKRAEIQRLIDRKTNLSAEDIKRLPAWFKYNIQESGTIITKKRGNSRKMQDVSAYTLSHFENDNVVISRQLNQCGFYLLVTSEEMTAKQARIAYSKRDCVEKVFQALKSSLGMDEIGVSSDDNLYGKSLIWFVAAILHSILFNKLMPLRVKDRKSYTVPAAVDKIDEIVADRNLNSNKYQRRYLLDKRQKEIFRQCGVSLDALDGMIATL